MVPKDLGLEFEDESEEQERLKREEDAKRKREANLHSNVDLEFEVPGMEAGSPAKGTAAPGAQKPDTKQAAAPAHARPAPAQQQQAQRPQQPQQAQAQRPAPSNVTAMPQREHSTSPSLIEAASNMDFNSGRMYSEVEMKALIRAAVAECKLEMIAEIASETKELEIKVTRVLGALGAKAPPLKKDLMQVQKLVQDHTKLSLKLVTSEDKKKAA